jgi:hypothetical protein
VVADHSHRQIRTSAERQAMHLAANSSTGPARQSVATLVTALECVQTLNVASSVIGVTSPGARDLQSNRSLAQPL